MENNNNINYEQDLIVYEQDLIIEDKRKRRRIIVNGEHVATAVYNPEDPMTYRRILNIQAMANGIDVKPQGYELTEEEQKLLEKQLETGEEFELINSAIQRRNNVLQGSIKQIDDLYAAVDEVFGKGVCEVLFKYSDADNNYFKTLITIAFKETNKARQVIKNQYKTSTNPGVMK